MFDKSIADKIPSTNVHVKEFFKKIQTNRYKME